MIWFEPSGSTKRDQRSVLDERQSREAPQGSLQAKACNDQSRPKVISNHRNH